MVDYYPGIGKNNSTTIGDRDLFVLKQSTDGTFN